MEKLQLESTGSWTTLSGLVAIDGIPTSAKFLDDDGNEFAYFECRFSPMSDVVRVAWPTSTGMGVFDGDIARALIARGWARNISEAMAKAYNNGVAAYDKSKNSKDKHTDKIVVAEESPVTPEPAVEVAAEPVAEESPVTPEPELELATEPSDNPSSEPATSRFKRKV